MEGGDMEWEKNKKIIRSLLINVWIEEIIVVWEGENM